MLKIWNFSIIIIIICICLFTSVSCVCASQTNDTVGVDGSVTNLGVSDDADLCISEPDVNVVDNFKANEIDDSGTFDDLYRDIVNLNPGDTYNIDKDYYYEGSVIVSPKFGVVVNTHNVTINGNGHVIDGKFKSTLFSVYANDVKIFNLSFVNSYYDPIVTEYDTYSVQKCSSPVNWEGNNGVLSGCKFCGNSAPAIGGALTWSGKNGQIINSIFMNNIAGIVGGAIYICGSDNKIRNCIFYNTTSLIGGESIYIDRNHVNCNLSAIYDGKRLFTDGKVSDIDVDYFSYSYKTLFYDEEVDLIPMIYAAMISQEDCVYLDSHVSYYAQMVGKEFILILSDDIGDGLIYQKCFNFYDIESLNDVYEKLIKGDFKLDLKFIKVVNVYNSADYEYARTLKSNCIISSYQALVLIKDFACFDESYFNDALYLLEVDFKEKLTIDSKKTWNPSNSGFDAINIQGHGSTIKTKSGNREENTWVTISNEEYVFSASDLTINGFNTAVENLGGLAIFRFVNFDGNHMDYWFDKDWGAAIRNAGMCTCINCSFTNNRCDKGGAIFNQGNLTLTNCIFKDNDAEAKGDDVLNADNGTVYINGEEIIGSQGCVEYVKSMSTFWRSLISTVGVVVSFGLGFMVGVFSLNPAFGVVVGAVLGAGIGALCANFISDAIYNVNANRWILVVSLIAGCTLAGAIGGYVGCCMGQIWAAQDAAINQAMISSTTENMEGLSQMSGEMPEFFGDMSSEGSIAEVFENAELSSVENVDMSDSIRVLEGVIE